MNSVVSSCRWMYMTQEIICFCATVVIDYVNLVILNWSATYEHVVATCWLMSKSKELTSGIFSQNVRNLAFQLTTYVVRVKVVFHQSLSVHRGGGGALVQVICLVGEGVYPGSGDPTLSLILCPPQLGLVWHDTGGGGGWLILACNVNGRLSCWCVKTSRQQ